MFDSNLSPPPRINRRVNRLQGLFRTPDGSFSSMDEASNTNTPSSNCTAFYSPERPLTSRVSIESNSIDVPRLAGISYSPGNSPSSRYFTPQSSPKKTGIMSSAVNSIVASPTNKSVGSSRFSKLSVTNGRNTTDYHHSDRFIPSRASSNLNFSVWDGNKGCDSHGVNEQSSMSGSSLSADAAFEGGAGSSRLESASLQQPPLLDALLRSELLGENIDPTPASPTSSRMNGQTATRNRMPLREGGNFLRFNQSPRETVLNELYGSVEDPTSEVNSFSLSPVGLASSNRLSSMPQKRKRRIAKVPFKVLDAPALADDFYLNLVDWSLLNVLAVGLGSCVYLWSACTSKVTKLCDLGDHTQEAVTSVAWTQRGIHLAVGVHNGEVQIWDTVKCRKVRTMPGHSARIGALSWSGSILASGSRDRNIYLRDVRSQQPFTSRLTAHKQEVCGLKWSFDEPAHLASGGNDNKLLVWDIKNQRQPLHKFAEHTAAVKAIAWSPHQHGLLASGGGTADRCIRFWNALSGSSLNSVDTGSQVCNLSWSQNCNELVSTHGYSLNQIAIWKYPTMHKVATLTGHTYRVLYLAMSPDGSTIVTGAGDETLRFWQVFPGPRSHDKSSANGLLFPNSPGSILR